MQAITGRNDDSLHKPLHYSKGERCVKLRGSVISDAWRCVVQRWVRPSAQNHQIGSAASLQDRDGARLVFQRLNGVCKKLRLIWVDGAYRGQLMAWVASHLHFVLRPVLRADGQKGFSVIPRRWVVERPFGWLNQYRRLSRDYEVLPKSNEAMIYIAMSRLMLRRLAPV